MCIRDRLSDFIGSLIANEGQSLIADSIPQKGLNYIIDSIGSDSDMAFVGYVRQPQSDSSEAYKSYYRKFVENDSPQFYYSGRSLSKGIDLRSVRYVFPSLPGNGYYRVKRIYSERRDDLFLDQEEQEDKSMRIVFELGEFISLGEKKLKFSFIGSGNTFIIPQTGAFMPLKQIRAEYEQIINGMEV